MGSQESNSGQSCSKLTKLSNMLRFVVKSGKILFWGGFDQVRRCDDDRVRPPLSQPDLAPPRRARRDRLRAAGMVAGRAGLFRGMDVADPRRAHTAPGAATRLEIGRAHV